MTFRLIFLVLGVALLWHYAEHPRKPQKDSHRRTPISSAHWATKKDLAPLLLSERPTKRILLGRLNEKRGPYVAVEGSHSLLVIGPTQSGKTTGIAIPAMRSWEGPVVATSVKTDLVRDTFVSRSKLGTTWVYDPSGVTGLANCNWNPLEDARTLAGAQRLASALIDATRVGAATSDGEFWYASAAKLLAPLFFAAAHATGSIDAVKVWLDTQESAAVFSALSNADAPPEEIAAALRSASASFGRDERQKSALYATAETIVDTFVTPTRIATNDFSPRDLFEGENTLYLCAPSHEQRRLRPLFSALVARVLHEAYERASLLGAPLTPPLLIVLDEAANIAPIVDLDAIAATGSGHGITLVSVFQDIAQIEARYGEKSHTVVNNHRARLFLPGMADLSTLSQVSQLAGETEKAHSSVTMARGGERSVTKGHERVSLLTPDSLRRLGRGQGVLIYGSFPPAKLTLVPWFEEEKRAWVCGVSGTGKVSFRSPRRRKEKVKTTSARSSTD